MGRSVWDDLCDSPAESQLMQQRSALMRKLGTEFKSWGLAKVDTARRAGISPNRYDDLLAGHIDQFSLDELQALARRNHVA